VAVLCGVAALLLFLVISHLMIPVRDPSRTNDRI